jgi:orotate phosphoribosyltransferase
MATGLSMGSDTRSSHYSQSFNTALMKQWARASAVNINKVKNIEFPKHRIVLVYTGMSGVSHAMFLSAALHRNGVRAEHLYVRKGHEKSHGSSTLEYSMFEDYNKHQYVLVFVDDFTSTGATRKRCLKMIFKEPILKDKKIKFSGLITCTYKAPCPVAWDRERMLDYIKEKP